MKAKLVPLYFEEMNAMENKRFRVQLNLLKQTYLNEAEFLPPVCVGSPLPDGADAIVFPLLMYGAYRHDTYFHALEVPFIVLTSKYGTVEMWDWEIITYLRSCGCMVFSPYTVELAKVTLRAIAVKCALRAGAKFVIFQESPGDAVRPDIFKRFYWYEQDSVDVAQAAFGCRLEYRSWKVVCERAKTFSAKEADRVCDGWAIPLDPAVPRDHYIRAVKLYMAICEQLEMVEGAIAGVGANCMNEANLCDTTPCLAWNMLFEKRDITWACEGDTMTMLSIYILWHSLRMPLMMTNIYPFLSGLCALNHEKIDQFPDVLNPDNCALVAHCGYFGFVPRVFCKKGKWMFRNKVLSVTSPTAMALDCEFEEGPISLVKLYPDFHRMILIKATMDCYVQYPGSHCLNGAILRYANGHDVMENLCSHHILLIPGDIEPACVQLAKIFGFELVKL